MSCSARVVSLLLLTLGRCAVAADRESTSALDAAAASAPAVAFDAEAYQRELPRRQAQLRAAVATYDERLSAMDDREARTWRERLAWDDWAAATLADESWPLSQMRGAAERFFLAIAGLEDPAILELRRALVQYLDCDAAGSIAGDDPRGCFDRSVDVAQRAAAGEDVEFARLEQAAWWLAATGQAPELLERLRRRYSGPVIIGQIHRDIVDAKIAMFEEEVEEVRETKYRLQNATVVGRATVKSLTRAELVDGDDDVRLRVTTSGTIASPHNRSTSGRVRVTSESSSQFKAVAELFFDGQSFAVTEPKAEAETTSTVHDIDAPQMIRYAAAKRVRENKPAVEADVEAIIETEVAAAMREQIESAVADFNLRTMRFLAFLQRTGNNAEKWSTRLTDGAVVIGYQPSLAAGLGAPQCDPPPLVDDEVISLSLHDSALTAILADQVAGSAWRDLDFSKMQRELTGGNTEEHMIGLAPERWSVRWSWRQPVLVRFTQDAVELTYRFDEAEIDGRRCEIPMMVRLDMRLDATELGHQLRRLRPAIVESQDGRTQLPDDVRRLLVRKFSRTVDEPFYLDGLQFPAGGELDGLSGFRAVGVELQRHWVHLKYSNRGHVPSPMAADAQQASR